MCATVKRGSSLSGCGSAVRLRHTLVNLCGSFGDPQASVQLLTIRQIIGLRFAPDEEFVQLAARAATEGMPEDAIKRAVKNWRGDLYRV